MKLRDKVRVKSDTVSLYVGKEGEIVEVIENFKELNFTVGWVAFPNDVFPLMFRESELEVINEE